MDPNSASYTTTVLKFELFPDRNLTLLPYHNVKNSPEVFAALRSGKLPGTGFLNPAYILSAYQIHVAANKALYYQATQSMITKELTTETLYILSAQRNIGLSFKEFGIRDDRPQFIAFVYDATDTQIQLIREIVKGDAISMESEEYSKISQIETIIKHYKVEPTELQLGSLESAVVNRIVVKDI